MVGSAPREPAPPAGGARPPARAGRRRLRDSAPCRLLRTAAPVLVTAALLAPAAPAAAGHGGPHRTVTYSVASQGDVAGSRADLAAVAAEALTDPRGWALGGSLRFSEVASGGDFQVVLASPAVVAAASPVCSPQWSCRVGQRVLINDVRWREATASWTHGLAEYRRYVVLHEVGHWLGLGHEDCPGGDRLAPVMQQQSISLQGCLANVWPLVAEREAAGRRQGVAVRWSPVEDAYRRLGLERGPLGPPVTWERSTPGGVGRHQDFRRGAISWSPSTGAHEVHGAIQERWALLGSETGPLGFPTTDERPTPDRRGAFNHFDGSGGASIYWTPQTGAREVYGAIRRRWEALGWEQGPLGYPVTGELPAPDGRGRFTHFEGSGGGSVYWTPDTGAHEVYGAIHDRWAGLGFEQGPLGYPVTGELPTPDGRGRFTHFAGSGGGSVYWTAATGAHEVHGPIRDRWAADGWEKGPLGYPVRGVHEVDGGRLRADFEGGHVVHDPADGSTTVHLR